MPLPSTGLRLQLEADQIIGLNDGDVIDTVPDASANGDDATSSSSFRPTYKVLGGKPLMRFAGGQKLSLVDLSALTSGEIFIVWKITSGINGANKIGTGGGSSHYPFSDGNIYDNFGSTTRTDGIAPNISLRSTHIYSAYSAPSDWALFLNGVSIASTTTNTVSFSSTPEIGHNGAANYITGDVFAIILYDHKLSTSDRADVLAYLNAKYFSLLTDLIAWYPFDETSGNAIDEHGANDLTDHNTVGTGSGIVGTARDFVKANSEYFQIDGNAEINTGNIDFTWAFWINFDTLGADWNWIIDKAESGNVECYAYVPVSGSAINWIVNSTGAFGGDVGVASGTLASATWYFAVMWHDSVNNQIGIQVNNGTPQTVSHSAGVFAGTGKLNIGARAGTNDLNLDGRMDQPAFWKRILSSDEKTALYNGGAGVAYADLIPNITTTTLPNAALDAEYSEQLDVSGGFGNITWSVESGELPDGFDLDENTGIISGSSAITGTYNFVVRAIDELGGSDYQSLSIEVVNIFGDFDLLSLTGMEIDSVRWSGQVLRARFGRGYGAQANVGGSEGLLGWVISSTVLVDSEDYNDQIAGVPSFEYYWEFFKDHTTGPNEIFVIEFRGAYYHASFVDIEMNAEMFTIDLFGMGGGLQLEHRRVTGESYNADGSIDIS